MQQEGLPRVKDSKDHSRVTNIEFLRGYEIKVPIQINNQTINCVIDTGASMSIINKYLLILIH